MSDHDGWCDCPLLRFAAEVERLARFGMIARVDSYNGPEYLVIAVLRERYGCRGPRHGMCGWHTIAGPGLKLEPRDDVPLLRVRGEPLDESEARQYL